MKRFLSTGCLVIFLGLLVAPGNAGAQTAPTFVGVRTFLGAPYEPDLDKLKADFAVLGVPFDKGTWTGMGTDGKLPFFWSFELLLTQLVIADKYQKTSRLSPLLTTSKKPYLSRTSPRIRMTRFFDRTDSSKRLR